MPQCVYSHVLLIRRLLDQSTCVCCHDCQDRSPKTIETVAGLEWRFIASLKDTVQKVFKALTKV